MAAETEVKTVFISLRVTPGFKQLLALAAQNEQRSRTNLLEKLLLDYCKQNGVQLPATSN